MAAADAPTAADATQLIVCGAQWGDAEHVVDVSSVRPGWQWERATNTWARRKKAGGASASAAGSRGAGGGRGGGAKASRGARGGARGNAR